MPESLVIYSIAFVVFLVASFIGCFILGVRRGARK